MNKILLLFFCFLAPSTLLADEATNSPTRVACVGDSITYGAA